MSREISYTKTHIAKYIAREISKAKSICIGAGDGIRTHEHLRDWTLNPAPLTWLGNPRKRGSTPHALVLFNSIRRIKITPLQSTESCDSQGFYRFCPFANIAIILI